MALVQKIIIDMLNPHKINYFHEKKKIKQQQAHYKFYAGIMAVVQ